MSEEPVSRRAERREYATAMKREAARRLHAVRLLNSGPYQFRGLNSALTDLAIDITSDVGEHTWLMVRALLGLDQQVELDRLAALLAVAHAARTLHAVLGPDEDPEWSALGVALEALEGERS